MIQLLLRLTAPPGRRSETIQALRAVMLPVRLKRGTEHTHLGTEIDDHDVLLYLEEWQTVEELNEQLRSPRFAQILALMETMAEAPRLEFRFVSAVRGLDYVAEARGGPITLDDVEPFEESH